MKVSFDFDGTLGHFESIQKYAKFLIDAGIEVHITTRRFEKPEDYSEAFCNYYGIKDLSKQHKYLFELAEKIGIPLKNIHFTNMKDKSLSLKDNNFIWHLDDDPEDIKDINQNSDVIGISCMGSSWLRKCNRLLKNS